MLMERIHENFLKQRFMTTLGAEMVLIEEGRNRIACNVTEDLEQQHGFAHAGVLASIADSACGYAALSTMPEDAEVVSVEFKINLIRPCKASRIVAEGRVVKTGRTLVFTEGEVTDESGSETYATMTATMFCLRPEA
ncbi:MAG: PaaI family thioesterase [Acidobacteria bacterium]|nr:MAG: PaaI family thioesterase [Acidobacteriota bacterium]REK02969.1 MAG: PaaI family thioesterase [Acidobacteriota bacterium]REK13227.1 MAG: PaaI family thioesterase [Acidobacteriota bacterium]REK41221.1 MAG: PaaI family thioesterase [Acidobacteriota bacterium]